MGAHVPIDWKNNDYAVPEEWKKLLRTPIQLKGLSPEVRRRVRMDVTEKARQLAGDNFLAFAAKKGQLHTEV